MNKFSFSKTSSLKSLEQRISQIEKRNKRVEADKAWETSLTRRVLIAIATYLVIGLFMTSIGINNAWINALVPTMGFLLSTLSLQLFKDLWSKFFYKK